MSQNNPKYKRLESLLSDARQVDPDPDRAPDDQLSKTLKTQIPLPDATPVAQQAETLKAQVSESEGKPEVADLETPEIPVIVPDAEPAGREPAQPAREKASIKQAWAKLMQPRTPKVESEAQPTGTHYQLALWTAGIYTF